MRSGLLFAVSGNFVVAPRQHARYLLLYSTGFERPKVTKEANLRVRTHLHTYTRTHTCERGGREIRVVRSCDYCNPTP